MAPVVWLCLFVVMVGGTTAHLSVDKGKAFRRAVDVSGTLYNQAFPLYDEELDGTKSGSTVPTCQQPRETGICRANIPRWYYDNTLGSCRRFSYGGCRGNDNNFPTKNHCRAACLDEVVCPTDPTKTCRVLESACTRATCPLHPYAVCLVLPCSCQEVFIDSSGLPVKCYEPVTEGTTTSIATETTTLPPDVTTPESGDGEDDDKESGRALRHMAVVVMIMIFVGLLLLVLSAVLRKLRGSALRSSSTTTLIGRDSRASIISATPSERYDFT